MLKRTLLFWTTTLMSCASDSIPGNLKKETQLHVPDGPMDTESKAVRVSSRKDHVFKRSRLEVNNRFQGGAFAEARETGDNSIELVIQAENTPINDSGWYAFKIRAPGATSPRKVTVRLVYDGGTHRYQPKVSPDGVNWVFLDPADFTVDAEKKSASLQLTVGSRFLWVAAQPLLTTDHLAAWSQALATRHKFVSRWVIGRSVLGREIPELRITENPSGRKVLVMGRQHPPEATGSVALMAFTEELCSDSDQARKFREKFQVIVLPVVNPDGVDEGFWRHNRNGVDLNRDWREFRQPETAVVRDALLKHRASSVEPFSFAIDFHSTFKDIFYVIDGQSPENELVSNWIHALAADMPDYTYRVQPVAPVVPGAMIWIQQELGAPSVTYEVGDDTPSEKTREIARRAARALMALLLK